MAKTSKPSKGKGRPRRTTTRAQKDNSSNSVWRGSKEESKSQGNPYELYSKNQLLIENATKINTNNPLGTRVGMFYNGDWNDMVSQGFIGGNGHTRWNVVPGVATFEFVAGPGPSRDPNSAVNIAANALYSYIRHANSGAANYDSASLIMLMLAMDSAYMWHYALIRLYGTLNLYSAENRYYPRTLVAAQGFDFESMKKNMNNLQFQINRFGKILNSLYIPRFNVFLRHQWCCENYFVDDDSTKAQTYILKPAGLHFLQEATSTSTFGDLKYVPWANLDGSETPTLYLTYDQVVDVIDRFSNILQYSSDVAMISGDIKKAYGPENCMSVPSIADDFDKLPAKDDTVLSMIHNSFIADYSNVNNADLDIKQTFNTLGAYFYVDWDPLSHYNERFDPDYLGFFKRYWNGGKRLLNYYVDNPSSELITESTRFTAISNQGSEWAHGTEIIINQKIFFISATGMVPTFLSFKQISADLSNLIHCSAFNSYPLQFRFTADSTAQKITSHGIYGELENYTVVEYDQLAKLHEAAVLSEWDVPSIANYM